MNERLIRLIPELKQLIQDTDILVKKITAIVDKIGGSMGKQYKLGRLPSQEKDLKRRLKLSSYFQLPTPPPATNYREKATKTLSRCYKNDEYGDCTVAGAAHVIGVDTANTTKEVEFTDKAITDLYFKLTNGRDVGLNLGEVLKFWQKEGIDGHICGPYLSIPVDWDTIRACIAEFGCVYTGFYPVPSTWVNSEIWDKPTRGSGGHCVAFVDYDENYIYVSTWGEIRKATKNALSIFDEAYVVLEPSWLQKAPNGFNSHQLIEDLNALGANEPVPPEPVPPEPNPPTPPTPPPPPPTPIPEPVDWSKLIKIILDLLIKIFKK